MQEPQIGTEPNIGTTSVILINNCFMNIQQHRGYCSIWNSFFVVLCGTIVCPVYIFFFINIIGSCIAPFIKKNWVPQLIDVIFSGMCKTSIHHYIN